MLTERGAWYITWSTRHGCEKLSTKGCFEYFDYWARSIIFWTVRDAVSHIQLRAMNFTHKATSDSRTKECWINKFNPKPDSRSSKKLLEQLQSRAYSCFPKYGKIIFQCLRYIWAKRSSLQLFCCSQFCIPSPFLPLTFAWRFASFWIKDDHQG